jgi:hypothetical protein
MKNILTMKNNLIILLLIFAWTIGLTTESNSDAIFEQITIEYTLHEDGSQEYHYYKRLKLLSHHSFNRLYGETFILYNPQFQELKINLAQTTHSDGKITASPENAFNEVLPFFASKAPYYNHLREMVVTHTGTELNAVIELDYTIHTKAGYFPGMMADEILTESSPVMNKEIMIKIPANRDLNFKVLNYRTGPDVTTGKNQTVYRFNFSGIKPETLEKFQPGNKIHLPRLMFSTVTWEEAIEHIIGRSETTLKASPDMKAMIADLRQENRYDLSFILELNRKVTDEINHYPVPWQYYGFRSRNPLDTWKSNGGTDIEKSLLLAGLFREGGINALPVIVIPTRLYDEKIGCLTLISDFLVQVNPRDLEQIFLSAVTKSVQNRIFSLSGKTVITLGNPTQKEVVEDLFVNKVVSDGTFVLEDSMRLAGSIEVLLTETVNPYYQIVLDTNSLKSVFGGLSGSTDMKVDLVNTAQYRTLAHFNLKYHEPLNNFGDYNVLELPVNMAGTEKWGMGFLHSGRLTPVELPNTIDEQYSYSVSLPEGLRLVNPVGLIEKSAPFGELVIYISQHEAEIVVKKMLLITQRTIGPEDYTAFKEMMDLWNEKNFRRLFLSVR